MHANLWLLRLLLRGHWEGLGARLDVEVVYVVVVDYVRYVWHVVPSGTRLLVAVMLLLLTSHLRWGRNDVGLSRNLSGARRQVAIVYLRGQLL